MAEDRVAALVVMPPASGEDLSEGQPLSAATIERATPDPASVQRALRFFAESGFETGPLVGISFSIAAPRERMERFFPDFTDLEGSGHELPLHGLPANVRDAVSAVTTEAPPDFGPGNP